MDNLFQPSLHQDPSILYSSTMDTTMTMNGMQTITTMLVELQQQVQELPAKMEIRLEKLEYRMRTSIDDIHRKLDTKINEECQGLREEMRNEIFRVVKQHISLKEEMQGKIVQLKSTTEPCNELEKKLLLDEINQRCERTMSTCEQRMAKVEENMDIQKKSLTVDIIDRGNVLKQQSEQYVDNYCKESGRTMTDKLNGLETKVNNLTKTIDSLQQTSSTLTGSQNISSSNVRFDSAVSQLNQILKVPQIHFTMGGKAGIQIDTTQISDNQHQ